MAILISSLSSHSPHQLKQYTEDFDRERTAREEAVKVKNIVEEQSVKKDKELTSLRHQLNIHAQHQVCTILVPSDIVCCRCSSWAPSYPPMCSTGDRAYYRSF